MRFSTCFFLITVLGGMQVTGSAAQVGSAVPGQDTGSTRAEKAQQARDLFDKRNYPEAAALARQVLAEGPDGWAADDLRVRLCQAKAAGKDVGDPAASADTEPISETVGVRRPTKIFGEGPSFGRKARRSKAKGQVVLSALIDEDGCVKDPKVIQGLNPDVNQDVLDNLRGWVFKPAFYQGKPCKVFYSLSVSVDFDPK